MLKASGYREFLPAFFVDPSTKRGPIRSPKPLSYAEASRRAGFASRSFLRDVVGGRKSLSLASLERTSRALSLTGNWKRYFTALVLASLDGPGKHETKLQRLREQLARPATVELEISSSKRREIRNYLSNSVPVVFAACGSIAEGASEREISARTGLGMVVIGRALTQLMALNLIQAKNERFYPLNSHLALSKLGGDSFFRADYAGALKRTAERFRVSAEDGKSLFFLSSFSVDRERLPALNQRLRELMLEFVNEVETPSGDGVAELVLGVAPYA